MHRMQVIMIVESCDYLSLKHNQRFLHTSALAEDGKRQWECKEVNPWYDACAHI